MHDARLTFLGSWPGVSGWELGVIEHRVLALHPPRSIAARHAIHLRDAKEVAVSRNRVFQSAGSHGKTQRVGWFATAGKTVDEAGRKRVTCPDAIDDLH